MEAIGHRTATVLRLAVAGCFICHGTMALKNSSAFYSEWSAWVQQLFHAADYSSAEYLLRVLGVIDIVVGLSFLRPRPWRASFAWVIGWGAVTAFSRLYFLGSLDGNHWLNIARPMAETLSRAPNWLVPLVLLRQQDRWLRGAVACGILAVLLRYLAALNDPIFPYEVVKTGMPLWFFHATGAMAGACLAAMLFRAGDLLALSTMILVEAFNLLFMDWPHGALYTLLQAGEHLPVYVAFAWLAVPWLTRSKRLLAVALAGVMGAATGCGGTSFSGKAPEARATSTATSATAAATTPGAQNTQPTTTGTCSANVSTSQATALRLDGAASASCAITPNGNQPTPGNYATILTNAAPCDFLLPNVTVTGMQGLLNAGASASATIPTGTYWKTDLSSIGGGLGGKLGSLIGQLGVAHPFPVGPAPPNAPILDNGFLLVEPDGKTYLLADAGMARPTDPSYQDAATIANQVSQTLGFGSTQLLQPNPGTAPANYADGTVFKAGSVIALYDDTPDMVGTIDVNALAAASVATSSPAASAGAQPAGSATGPCGN